MRGFTDCVAFFALAALVACCAPHAIAGCAGSSPKWTSTPDQTSLQTCVDNASSGDTINVSAGSASWSGDVNVTGKNINIIGAGIGNTVIANHAISIHNLTASGSTVSVRVSGFTFNLGGNYLTIEASTNFRYDHNAFTQTSQLTCMQSYNNTPSISVNEGLFDHNTFTYCQLEELGGDYGNSGNSDNLAWSRVNPLGTSHAIYFEDNTHNTPDPSSGGYFNCWDEIQGGSYVIRFSSLDGCRVEAHGVQADNERAARSWEVYNNTMNNSHGISGYWPFSQRGGTGMIFHNTLDANWLNPIARLDGPRLNEDSISAQVPLWQYCDGTTQSTYNPSGGAPVAYPSPKTLIVDAQGSNGYRCRDQIGAGTDASTWAAGWNTVPPPQALASVYVWKNPLGGVELTVSVTCEDPGLVLCGHQNANIVQNRDYYTYNASFNGTSGIGEGTLATRPATCTTGVGYWATDQGNWNQSGNGKGQGVLYQCTATNVWTLYYTPYMYPHPLQGSSGAAQVAPPTSLKATVVVQ